MVSILALLVLLLVAPRGSGTRSTVLWCNRISISEGHIFLEIMPSSDFVHVSLHEYNHNVTVASYVDANPPRVLAYNVENSGKDANYSEIRILISKYVLSVRVLIHMSDEFNGSGRKFKYGEGVEMYRYHSIQLVLRQYGVFPYVGSLGQNDTKKVVQLLLEPNLKLLDHVRASQPEKRVTTVSVLQDTILRNLSEYSSASRIYNWSFIGLVGNRQGRRTLMNTFLEWHNHSFHEGISMLPPDMFDVYRRSKFVIIGRGQANLDCFRIYEAILAGAIPVMVGPPQEVRLSLDYNDDMPPLPVAESPDAAVALCKSLSDEKLDDLRYRLAQWYIRKVAMIRGALYACLEAGARRTLSEIPPIDKYNEFPAKRVRSTTNKDLFPLFKTLLYTKVANSSNLFINSSLDYISKENIDVLVGTLEKSVNETDKGALLNLLPGMSDFSVAITTETNVASKKWTEEHVMNNIEGVYNDEAIDGMFNLVVLTGNSTKNVNFLNKWYKWIKNMELIIIQQGDPSRFIQVPAWARYELHNKADMEKVVAKSDMWIFDIDGDGSQAATYGFLVADREFVFLLDRHCEPVDVDVTNLLYLHARNLLKPSLPYYYASPGRDPHHGNGSDFARGYPYSLRDGLKTGISFGDVLGPDGDSLTRLMKFGKFSADGNGTGRAGMEFVITLGHNVMFSLSSKNVVYNRRLLGSSFFLIHAISSKTFFKVHPDYYDILGGWILKVLADHVGFGIKSIVSPVQLKYIPEMVGGAALYDELKGDYLWLQYHEKLVRYLNSVKLSKGKAENDIGLSMGELLGKLTNDLPQLRPVFAAVSEMYRVYGALFNKYTGFHTGLVPVASRSTYQPRDDSLHKCAAYTIVHNDTNMLNVWLRYYTKYFANATFVYTHFISTDDEKSNHNHINADLYYKFKKTMHNFTLYGENAGFPMGFFVAQADLIQRRLFRYGYKCVLLSDIDEIVVPDPDVYPDELNGYLVSFINKSSNYLRVNAFALAHISESDSSDKKSLEPALDWSRNILEQRNYIYSQNKYCKPLLSKVPMRHKPGFHATFIPGFVASDNDLYMFHLKDVDRETCLSREATKNKLFREKGRQSDINKLLNTHILHHKADFCQFAMSIYSAKLNGTYDSTGKLRLSELKASFKKISV